MRSLPNLREVGSLLFSLLVFFLCLFLFGGVAEWGVELLPLVEENSLRLEDGSYSLVCRVSWSLENPPRPVCHCCLLGPGCL